MGQVSSGIRVSIRSCPARMSFDKVECEKPSYPMAFFYAAT